MILYLLRSTLCLAIILAVHYLLFEREKMENFKRWFLLGGSLLAFILPLLNLGLGSLPFHQAETLTMLNGASTSFYASGGEVPEQGISGFELFQYIYFAISGILLLRFFFHLFSILRTALRNGRRPYAGATLVLLDKETVPHSFLNYIFVNAAAYRSGAIAEEVLVHELAHVKELHSLDILVIEFLRALFWINPMVWLIKKAIVLNHEFLADDKVLRSDVELRTYQDLLLAVSAGSKVRLCSDFNFSVTKKRLQMMTRTKSPDRARNLAATVLPLLVILLLFFSDRSLAQETAPNTQTKSETELKDAFFKDATISFTDEQGRVIYKRYSDLTKDEKANIPPLPPAPPAVGAPMPPLPEGTVIQIKKGNDDQVEVVIDGKETAPPPPPAPVAPKEPAVAPVPPVPGTGEVQLITEPIAPKAEKAAKNAKRKKQGKAAKAPK